MKLRELESALGELNCFENPIAELEQYPTSAHLAAQVVHTMDASFGDISGKAVCDLGCGTGMLSIAVALSGAQYVLGLDVDQSALSIAMENASNMDVEGIVDYCNVDILSGSLVADGCSSRTFDTVIMNPPFGTKRKGVDMAFLHHAVQICKGAVYSMHKSATREYIMKRAKAWGANAQVSVERGKMMHLWIESAKILTPMLNFCLCHLSYCR